MFLLLVLVVYYYVTISMSFGYDSRKR